MNDTNDTTPVPITEDLKRYIGVVLAESSLGNSFEEMAGIAAVLLRQKAARGYDSWIEMAENEDHGFAFGFQTNVARNAMVLHATSSKITTDPVMSIAYQAVQHALSGGQDYSNGAYFWDGYDFKTNPHHFKKTVGFHYGDPSHNIFDVDEIHVHVQGHGIGVINNTKTKKVFYEYDYQYESTAAIATSYSKLVFNKTTHKHETKNYNTGTIFWKFNETYADFGRNGCHFR